MGRGSVEYSSISVNRPRWHSGLPSGNVASVPCPSSPAPGGTADGGVQRAAVGLYAQSPVNLDVWPAMTWVLSNSGDGAVQVTRRSHVGTSSDGAVGLVFRATDPCHLWAAFFSNVRAGDGHTIDERLYLWNWSGCGYGNLVSQYTLAPSQENFSQLKVVFSGPSIAVQLDGATVITADNSEDPLIAARGVGLYLSSALGRAYDWAAF